MDSGSRAARSAGTTRKEMDWEDFRASIPLTADSRDAGSRRLFRTAERHAGYFAMTSISRSKPGSTLKSRVKTLPSLRAIAT